MFVIGHWQASWGLEEQIKVVGVQKKMDGYTVDPFIWKEDSFDNVTCVRFQGKDGINRGKRWELSTQTEKLCVSCYRDLGPMIRTRVSWEVNRSDFYVFEMIMEEGAMAAKRSCACYVSYVASLVFKSMLTGWNVGILQQILPANTTCCSLKEWHEHEVVDLFRYYCRSISNNDAALL